MSADIAQSDFTVVDFISCFAKLIWKKNEGFWVCYDNKNSENQIGSNDDKDDHHHDNDVDDNSEDYDGHDDTGGDFDGLANNNDHDEADDDDYVDDNNDDSDWDDDEDVDEDDINDDNDVKSTVDLKQKDADDRNSNGRSWEQFSDVFQEQFDRSVVIHLWSGVIMLTPPMVTAINWPWSLLYRADFLISEYI